MKQEPKQKPLPESYGIYRMEMIMDELVRDYDRVIKLNNKSGSHEETDAPLQAIKLRMNELQLDIADLKALRQYKL